SRRRADLKTGHRQFQVLISEYTHAPGGPDCAFENRRPFSSRAFETVLSFRLDQNEILQILFPDVLQARSVRQHTHPLFETVLQRRDALRLSSRKQVLLLPVY